MAFSGCAAHLHLKHASGPFCTANGSPKILEALRRAIAQQGLGDEVQVTTCGSLGLCGSGPNMVVYPEGVWYSGVRASRRSAIITPLSYWSG